MAQVTETPRVAPEALQAPRGWGAKPWPPSIADVEPSLYGGASGETQAIWRYPVRWLAYASALAVAGGESRLIRAAHILGVVARAATEQNPDGSVRFGRWLRPAALANQAAVLAALGGRLLVARAAGLAAQAADGLLGLGDAEVRRLAQGLAAEAGAMGRCVALEWDGPRRLVPVDPAGGGRCAALPGVGVSGTWAGVRQALRGYGLEAPERPAGHGGCTVRGGDGALTVAWERKRRR